MRVREIMALTFALAVLGGAQAQAQQARPGARGQAEQPTPPPGEIKLIYEREFFQYPGETRRDPFAALAAAAEQGPRFEELRILGVIYSNRPGQSVAILADGGGQRFRVRQGDVVGNARVVDIGPLRVVFAVDNFGVVRQEMLQLKTKREGAEG